MLVNDLYHSVLIRPALEGANKLLIVSGSGRGQLESMADAELWDK